MKRNRDLRCGLAVAVIVPACTAVGVVADTLHVPSEYSTIQAGIDAAVDGDIVEIADGTYTGVGNINLDFGGKAIKVRSASGDPSLCIIDCQQLARGVTFDSGEGPYSVLDSVTITNGYVSYVGGGGLYCVDSSPTLRDCVIIDNAAVGSNSAQGGGVFLECSDATFINCAIEGNQAHRWGGGVKIRDGSPRFENCRISHNSLYLDSSGDGGGVDTGELSAASFFDCTIEGNTATDFGGGVSGGGVFVNCVFRGNTAGRGGGGAEKTLSSSAICFVGCSFIDNVVIADNGGGGGALCGSSSFTNCLFVGNTTGGVGGGLVLADEREVTATLTNCTFAANEADWAASLLVSSYQDPTTVNATNCVLWNGSDQVWVLTTLADLSFTYSNIQGGGGESWFGEGCIDAEPHFVDPVNGDYRLAAGSHCIDAGDNTAVPADAHDLDGDGDTSEPLPIDLTGRSRFVDDPDTIDTGYGTPPLVDMGANEFQLPFDACDASDLDGDGEVGQADLGVLLGAYGIDAGGDVDDDGDTDQADLAWLLSVFGETCD